MYPVSPASQIIGRTYDFSTHAQGKWISLLFKSIDSRLTDKHIAQLLMTHLSSHQNSTSNKEQIQYADYHYGEELTLFTSPLKKKK